MENSHVKLTIRRTKNRSCKTSLIFILHLRKSKRNVYDKYGTFTIVYILTLLISRCTSSSLPAFGTRFVIAHMGFAIHVVLCTL